MSATTSISFEYCPYWPPDPMAVSSVQKIGGTLEVTTSRSPPPNLSKYRRLSRKTYLDSSTGEVRTYRSRDKPSPNSINRAFKKLNRMIRANFTDGNGVMLTLTVANELPATPTALYSYFGRFWRKVKYQFPSAEYVAVIEPHQSSRFHYHVLLKLENGFMPTLSKDFVGECWTVGIVHITRIYDVVGLAGYLTSKKKRRAWVQNYVPRTRLWRSSRGIIQPITKTMNREQLEEYVKNNDFHFRGGDRIKVICDSGAVVNTITHEKFVRR